MRRAEHDSLHDIGLPLVKIYLGLTSAILVLLSAAIVGCGGESSKSDAPETAVASPTQPTSTAMPASELVVEVSTAEERSPMIGESVVLNVTVRNQGAGSSGAATLTLLRSADSIISAEDVEEDKFQIDVLAPSESSEEIITITLPVTPGTYHYGACVESVIRESNIAANCSGAVAIAVLPVPPDLLVDTATAEKESVVVGQAITLGFAIRNQGGSLSQSTTLTYYRSTDPVISAEDSKEGTLQITGSDPEENSELSVTVTAQATHGTYYYGACVDTVPHESDITNNCSDSVAVTILPLPSDLVVEVQLVEVDNLRAGQALTLSARVRNQGAGPSVETTLNYYRSTDSKIPSDDVEEGTVQLLGLAPADSTLETVSFTAPSMPGTYQYWACVDPVTREADSANNCSDPVGVTVLPLPPDLVVDTSTVQAGSLVVGHSFTLAFTVKNLGSGDSDATDLTYFRTSDTTTTSDDVEEGTVRVLSVAPLGSSHATLQLTAPPEPGIYYYRACTDSVAHELDSANNCSGYVAVNIFPYPPDLAVGAPTLGDRTQLVGQILTFNVTVSNQGEGASGTSSLRFVRSDDKVITSRDIEEGFVQVEGLKPSGFTHESIALASPPSPGTYYYGACVDLMLREPDISNNCSESVAVTVAESVAVTVAHLPAFVDRDVPRVNVGPQTIINSIDARVAGFRLYDRRWDEQGDESFVYTNTFDELTTGDIYWELNLIHAPRSNTTRYAIEIVTYRPNGSVLQRRHFGNRISDSKVRSSPSSVLVTPMREPGSWKTGTYRVELLVASQLVASGEFQIVRGRIPKNTDFNAITESLNWSEVSGTLDERLGLLAFADLMEVNPKLASTVAANPWVQQGLTEGTLRFLRVLHILAAEDMGLAQQVAEFPWLKDEVTYDEWLALRTLTMLAVRDSQAAGVIGGLDWLSGYVTAIETKTLSVLGDIILEHPNLAEEVLNLSWLWDDLTHDESAVIRSLRDLAYKNAELPLKVLAMPFMHGAIGPIQANVMTGIASASPYPLSSDTTTLAALEWLIDDPDGTDAQIVHDLGIIRAYSDDWFWAISGMPFLKTIEPTDAQVTQALARLFDSSVENAELVVNHPRIKDGITNEETRILATLSGVSRHNPTLLEKLLDPSQTTMEERNITLPLAGEVTLTIIRTSSGSKRTMDLLETAVRRIEGLMSLPFPTPNVNYLFEIATPTGYPGRFAGANLGSSIVSLPWHDDDTLAAHVQLRHLAHEVSHYYWTGSRPWVDEGVANLIQSVVVGVEYNRSISQGIGSCAHARNISELESLKGNQQDRAFSCNYYLGERLFHALYRSLGDAAFRSGLSRLYLMSQHDDSRDECKGTSLEICHVEAAFATGLDEATAENVRSALGRWYYGN